MTVREVCSRSMGGLALEEVELLAYLQFGSGVYTKSWLKLFMGSLKDREIYCSALSVSRTRSVSSGISTDTIGRSQLIGLKSS